MGGEGEPVVVAEWLRKAIESERVAPPVMEWVMCSTCCGFVWRKRSSAGEVDEMLADVRLMRAAVMMPKLHQILDGEGPDAAMKKRLEILLVRRRMMEHKRCPTCYRSLSDMPEPQPQPQPYEEDKAMVADAGSKKTAVGDETMAADAGSNKKKNKRSEEEEEGKKKSSSESSGEYSMGRTGKRRTKMVTCRLSKEFVQEFIQAHPPIWPFTDSTSDHIQRTHARQIAEYEVECEVHANWKSQCDTKGYVEYQEEVTDNEDA